MKYLEEQCALCAADLYPGEDEFCTGCRDMHPELDVEDGYSPETFETAAGGDGALDDLAFERYLDRIGGDG